MTETYTLSLHDALPICDQQDGGLDHREIAAVDPLDQVAADAGPGEDGLDDHRAAQDEAEVEPQDGDDRSEEHTSELQSQSNLVCRLLLEKQKLTMSAKR